MGRRRGDGHGFRHRRSLADRPVQGEVSRHIKAIGTIKLVGVIGLIVPPLVGILPVLSPVAACGLMLVMTGAATTRFRRSEWGLMAGDTAYLLVFAFLAWGRFALVPFGS